LLREAGIPARYATGFSVQEQTGSGDYVVRERHAHAWVRAWMDGKWVDIDTTPPQWFSVEGGKGGLWESLSDAWSWLKFAWGRYQTNEEDAVPRPVLIGLLVLLFGWLAWRIFRQPAKRALEDSQSVAQPAVINGADSEFYRIEALLASRNQARNPSEPVTQWLARLAIAHAVPEPGHAKSTDLTRTKDLNVEELQAIARLHYRLRFDPKPMDGDSRDDLRIRSERWLRSVNSLL